MKNLRDIAGCALHIIGLGFLFLASRVMTAETNRTMWAKVFNDNGVQQKVREVAEIVAAD